MTSKGHEIHFDRPVQTATAIGKVTGIDRGTLTRAATDGRMGNAAYKSGDAWLIDTSHSDFRCWLEKHWQHHKSKIAESIDGYIGS